MSELGRLATELQVHGVRVDPLEGNPGRRGGAGPSDHRALNLDGTTVMVPVYNDASASSPYKLASSGAALAIEGPKQGCSPEITTPREPAFYGLSTSDGISYRSMPCCIARMCWPPRCCRPASASEIDHSLVSSARLNSRLTMAPWFARRPSRWRKLLEAAVRLDGVKQW